MEKANQWEMELKKSKTYEIIELEREKVGLAMITWELSIMLTDTNLMDDHVKGVVHHNKEVNKRKKYDQFICVSLTYEFFNFICYGLFCLVFKKLCVD